MSLSFSINGHAWTVPKPVESSQIERDLKWPEGWSQRYSGVKKRHWVDHPESNGELGADAALQAMDIAGVSIAEIDLLIFAGATYDYTLPNQASIIKSKLDNESRFNIPCIDVDTTCLSFITGLEIAVEKLALSKATNILLISAEVSSNGLNPENRETYSLFGDAAAAFVITKGSDITIMNSLLRSYSSGVYDTIIEGSGNKKPPSLYPFTPETHTFKMNGKKLLRLAKKNITVFMQ
jgi:3-oxoacyl-[acyl-carrier-protein] synthase-3